MLFLLPLLLLLPFLLPLLLLLPLRLALALVFLLLLSLLLLALLRLLLFWLWLWLLQLLLRLLDPAPGLENPQLLLDLWRSPALEGKYADIVKQIKVLEQPVRCVTSAAAGPRQSLHTVVIVTLSTALPASLPQFASWTEAWQADVNQDYLAVDAPLDQAMAIRRLLHALQQGAGTAVHWEGPTSSPASTRLAPRVAFYGYLPSDMPVLTTKLLMRDVRTSLPAGTMIGNSRLYRDGSAMLAQLASTVAAAQLSDLIEEGIFLSPSSRLMLPVGDQRAWEDCLTDLATSDAEHCIKEVRWRRSRNSGRPWACPQMLQPDLHAAIQRARARREGRDAQKMVNNQWFLMIFGLRDVAS